MSQIEIAVKIFFVLSVYGIGLKIINSWDFSFVQELFDKYFAKRFKSSSEPKQVEVEEDQRSAGKALCEGVNNSLIIENHVLKEENERLRKAAGYR